MARQRAGERAGEDVEAAEGDGAEEVQESHGTQWTILERACTRGTLREVSDSESEWSQHSLMVPKC